MTSILKSDAFWYYEYLPALFIRHDIEHIQHAYHLENGKTLNKYTYGVALLQSPFFFAAQIISKIRCVPSTGYETIHSYMALLAGSFYFFAGLIFVFLLLKKWFGSITSWPGIILIYFGTNTFHYVYYEPGTSHVYSLFSISGLLFFLERFFTSGYKQKDYLYAVLFFCVTTLIRPVNGLAGLLFLFYNVYTIKQLKERISFYSDRAKWVLASIFLLFLFSIPQLYYWKLTAGEWLLNPYSYFGESFTYLKQPKIPERMFGVQCGWIPYSPVMIFSLAGLAIMAIKKKYNSLAILAVFLPLVYLCGSWWSNFGCSFGFRPFIDFYPLLIIPIAYLINSALSFNNLFTKISVFLMVLLFVFFNIKLAFAYSPWPFCESFWSWNDYWSVVKKIFSWN